MIVLLILSFEVYSQGGNQADRKLEFVFNAEDGSHSFRFKAPDFKDAKKTTVTKKVKKNTKYKVSASGRYKGKVLNKSCCWYRKKIKRN